MVRVAPELKITCACDEVVAPTANAMSAGQHAGLGRDGLIKAFHAHNDAVKAAIPSDRLLVYQVKEGWDPLCAFLGLEAPDEDFPRSNSREEFWDRLRPKN
jgi:hypothetical protein